MVVNDNELLFIGVGRKSPESRLHLFLTNGFSPTQRPMHFFRIRAFREKRDLKMGRVAVAAVVM